MTDNNGWVSVNDRLPEDQVGKDYADDIMIWNGDREFSVFRKGRFLKRDWMGAWSNVTHWQILPPPPKK
jgi:hypothetical protein